MMISARNLTRGLLGLMALSLSLAAPVQAAQSVDIGFNPTGGGIGGTTNFGTIDFSTIDVLPGNALAVGFNKSDGAGGFRLPNPGETFTLLYQANVGSLVDGNGDPVFTYSNGTTGQLTVVAELTERVVTISGGAGTGTATFRTAGGGTLTYYFNPTRIASNLAGTGFAPGTTGNPNNNFTQVYQGTILGGDIGNFTSNPLMGVGNLDQFGIDNYTDIDSVAGAGGTNLTVRTSTYDPAFFVSAPPPAILLQQFNTSNNLPFNQANPSAIFFNDTPGATVGSVGSVNGQLGGPNVIFQSDANASFQAVPEPGTIGLALMAIGFASVGGLRASRRRSK